LPATTNEESVKTKILPSILLAFACLGGIAASTPEKKNVPETSKVLFENDRQGRRLLPHRIQGPGMEAVHPHAQMKSRTDRPRIRR
jgi:hypothetical protein